jgi:hypothetical protein
MQLMLRIPQSVLTEARRDLGRPHSFAFERIGFFRCRPTERRDLVVITGYDTVPDEHYISDSTAGASIGPNAIQAAMQRILSHQVGQIHVHLHEHDGPTGPSSTDWSDQPRLIRSFRNLDSALVHGIIILSNTHAWGAFALPGVARLTKLKKVSVVSGGVEFL